MPTYSNFDHFDKIILENCLEKSNDVDITKYSLKSETKLSQSTILHHLDKLEKHGFLIIHSEIKLKNGHIKKFFRPSLLGLVSYLQYYSKNGTPISYTKMKKLIDVHSDFLPWISSNLNYLSDYIKIQ